MRLSFLLLLVLLLPLKGAVAAAMMCPPPAGHLQHAAIIQGNHGAVHAHHDAPHDVHHDHLAHPAAMGTDHNGHDDRGDMANNHDAPAAGDHGVQDGKCDLCAATCSLSTLPGQAPRVPEPPDVAATRFPPLAVPTASFLSGGQDRPPRST